MSGRFLAAQDNPKQESHGNSVRWVSKPAVSGSNSLVFIDATIAPGGRHSFHLHPQQDEIVLVISGTIQQWLGEEMRELRAGDAAYVPKGTVHATFNPFPEEAHLVVAATPCVGPEGHELVAVDGEEPWASLTAAAAART